jgi:hypothetical protein
MESAMDANVPTNISDTSPNANGGVLASYMGGATLLVAAIIDALGMYFHDWPGASLLFVVFAGFVAFLIGLRIEGND